MPDGEKSREALLEELAALRKRVTGLEASALKLGRPASMLEAEGIFLSALMANIPDNIYFKDLESRFLMVNRAMSDRFGMRDPGEIIGKTDSDFFLPEHANEARKDELAIIRTGIPVVGKEEHEVTPDGGEHWVSTTKLPLHDRDGKIIGTFGVSRDVTQRRKAEDALRRSEEALRRHTDTLEERVRERTAELEQINRQLQREVQERRRAEAALRQSEERYRQLLATTPTYVYTVWMRDGIAISTEHGSGCVAITGYTPEEYTANRELWIQMVHPEDKEVVLGLLAVDLASEKRRPIEHRILHKDGSIRWVRNTIVHHYDDRGRLMHYDGLVEDITERKLAEEALREGERLRAVSSLAGGAAHSFNTVLSVINGNASSIADSVLPGTDAHRDALRIIAAVSHASDLTRRLLGMASAFKTERPSASEPVSLNQVVKDTLELVEHSFSEKNIRVNQQLAESAPHIRAVAGQVIDTLMSVLTNAAEAMPDGGSVGIRTRVREIRRPSRWNPKAKPGRYAVLYVSDTGVGMGREIRDRIFDPFFTSGKGPASFGLGLTITRNIVESWGGWVDVRSRVNAGTLFRIFFPAVEVTVPAAVPEDAIQTMGRGVLIVDDDQELIDFMTGGLESAGFRVYAAKTASDGLALCRARCEEIAVSVIDVVMPDDAGRQVVEAILAEDPKARIVVTSGFSRDYVRHSLAFGAWSYLQKPFEREALVDAVKAALRTAPRKTAAPTPSAA